MNDGFHGIRRGVAHPHGDRGMRARPARPDATGGAGPAIDRIALFFTLGNSLEVWDRYGILEREIALYQALATSGVATTFVTYGRRERPYLGRVPGIEVCFNSWGLPDRLYQLLVPFLHGVRLRRCRLFKTNQANGAQVALRASRMLRKPLVVRCGYMWSDFAARYHGPDSRDARDAREIESRVFPAADRIVVTTGAMLEEIAGRIPLARSRIRVVPNYVDTTRFRPDSAARRTGHLVFVGRLAEQKNVGSLLKAIEPLDSSITIVGAGAQEEALKRQFGTLNGRLEWRGNVSHGDMPAVLNQASVFVLPSLFEGHPKALLEAMACAVPVLGADRPGIREVIEHGRNGFLCEPDPESIRVRLEELLADPALSRRLGEQGRRFVESRFSLERIVDRELCVFESVVRTCEG